MSDEVVEATEVSTPERAAAIAGDDSPSVAVIMESLEANDDMMDAVAAAIVDDNDAIVNEGDTGGDAADESPQRRSRRKRGM